MNVCMPHTLSMIPKEWFETRKHLSYTQIADLITLEFGVIVTSNSVQRAFRALGIKKVQAPRSRKKTHEKTEFERILSALMASMDHVNGCLRVRR